MPKKRRTLYKFCVSILWILCILSACEGRKEESGSTAFTETEMTGKGAKEDAEADAGEETPEKVCVYVCGQVAKPGVYELEEGDRITHALLAAGGTTESASPVSLNLAARLTDGQMIYVPSAEEAEAAGGGSAPAGILPDTGDDKVNLNTADKEELMTLSGIGESRAEAILSYREEHGGFKSIEEIKEIEGIKDGIFNRIKEQIKVV